MFDPTKTAGLEKATFVSFVRNYTWWKRSFLTEDFVSLNDKIQLPNNSVLHLLDNMNKGLEHKDTPEITNPLIINEVYPKFIYHNTHIVTPEEPLYVKTNFKYIISGINGVLQTFNKTYRSFIRPVLDPDKVVDRNNALLVISHCPLWRFRVMGKLSAYKRFDMILRSIVTNMLTIKPGKHQFLWIPLQPQMYSKMNILRPLKNEPTPATLASTNDDYFFLINMLGAIYPKEGINSVFNYITEDYYDFIHFILTVNNQVIIFNLRDIKNMMVNEATWLLLLKRINDLKSLGGITEEITTTLEETEPDEQKEVEERVDKGTTKDTPTSTTSTKVTPKEPTTNTVVTKTFDEPSFQPKVPTIKHVASPPPVELEKIDQETKITIDKMDATPAQKMMYEKVAKAYKDIKVGEVTIGEVLSKKPDNTVDKGSLSFLKDTIPDEGMLESSIIDLDKEYLKKSFQKDLFKTITAFNKNGLFLVDYTAEEQSDELNRIVHHKVTYQDASGKRHTSKFKYPYVKPDGTFTVNGITSRMKKQQINIPICKISPTRVSLAASYKTLVQRDMSSIRSYKSYISKYITKANAEKELVKYKYGINTYTVTLPYEYTVLGGTYSQINISKYHLSFNYNTRESLGKVELENKYGVLVGKITGKPDIALYMGMNNRIYVVNTILDEELEVTTIPELLEEVSGINLPVTTEWTDLKILDQKLPIIFVLGYRFGLTNILKYLKVNYQIFNKGTKIELLPSDIAIRFNDKVLVFNRYPIEHSLIVAGLALYKTNTIDMEEFDKPDIYYDLLLNKGISTNYIKGIDTFFDLFLDPITENVLREMGEPTNVKDLLIRASNMLSTESFIEPSAMRNHRLRTYDRFHAILYDEIARKIATRRAHNKGDSLSINPEAVFQRIIQDQAVISIEEINPIHDIKEKTSYTHTGVGGRTPTSFVKTDRKYPDDGVGIISEATPDSGKVSITAYTSMNPTIKNLTGLYEHPEELDPTNLLSITSLVLPKACSDDKIYVPPMSNRRMEFPLTAKNS